MKRVNKIQKMIFRKRQKKLVIATMGIDIKIMNYHKLMDRIMTFIHNYPLPFKPKLLIAVNDTNKQFSILNEIQFETWKKHKTALKGYFNIKGNFGINNLIKSPLVSAIPNMLINKKYIDLTMAGKQENGMHHFMLQFDRIYWNNTSWLEAFLEDLKTYIEKEN